MAEGYDCTGNGDCSCSWLDELLCEYVDGVMDPSVRAAFEECLRADPMLAEQVACLRHTRTLLGRHGCRVQAPQGLQSRVRRRLAREMVYAPPYFSETTWRFVAVGSVVVAVVAAGLMLGAAWMVDKAAPVAGSTASSPSVVQQEILSGLRPATMTPLPSRSPLSNPAFLGQPAATPLRLTHPVTRVPEVFFQGQRQRATLQRRDGAP